MWYYLCERLTQRMPALRSREILIWRVLTYMATLEHLIATGKLKKHEPDLEDAELPERVVCFTPELDTWLYDVLRIASRDRGRDLTPFEQTEQIFYDFVIGRPMAYSIHIRQLDPLRQHVWELKTTDVRILGWFPKKAHFVAVCGALKKVIPRAKHYAPLINSVVDFRATLDLDEPKSIEGATLNVVL